MLLLWEWLSGRCGNAHVPYRGWENLNKTVLQDLETLPNKTCYLAAITGTFLLPYLKTSKPRQNGRHFADSIFKCVFLSDNIWILINISLKFVPKAPINNILVLVQIMAWHWWKIFWHIHVYACRHQWVKSSVCNSFKDWSPVGFMYRSPIFK